MDSEALSLPLANSQEARGKTGEPMLESSLHGKHNGEDPHGE